MRAIRTLVLMAASAAIGLAHVVGTHAADFGKNEYVRSCAACHGMTGKGNGPVAKSLSQPPADLTRLSEANGGVFPVSRVYDVIDGRIEVMTHGTREMPGWGEVYGREVTSRVPRDVLTKEMVEVMVRVRILGLIEHLSTLQAKDAPAAAPGRSEIIMRAK
jgi:mono/diheme cytochrome c family protein